MNGEPKSNASVFTALARMAVAGIVTSIVLIGLDQWGPARAVREFFLQSLLMERALDRPAPALDDSFLLINFDDVYCAARSQQAPDPATPEAADDCLTTRAPARQDIANAITVLAQQDISAIVVDFAFEPRACDGETLALTRAIIAAAQAGKPVFLLQRLVGPDTALRTSPTLFHASNCGMRLTAQERAYVEGPADIFLGWAAFERHERRGFSEATRPWLFVHSAEGSPLAPSLPLLLAVWRADPALLTEMEHANFLVRPREIEGARALDEIRTCPAPEQRCALAVPLDRTIPSERLRLSYRMPWPALSESLQYRWNAVIGEIGVTDLRPGTVDNFVRFGLRAQPIALIGTSAEAYRDLHVTPVGLMPGHLVAANAYLDFRDGRFLRDRTVLLTFAGELLDIATLLAAVAVIFSLVSIASAIFTDLSRPLKLKQKSRPHPAERAISPKHIGALFSAPTDIRWSIAVLLAAALATYWYWRSFDLDFRDGVFSFAILSSLAALFELGQSAWRGLEAAFTRVVSRAPRRPRRP